MRRRLRVWGPAAIWAAVILLLAGEEFSGPDTRTWLGWIVTLVWPDATERVLGLLNFAVRKGAHVFVYLVLGVLLERALRLEGVAGRRGLSAVGLAVAVSFADEGRQALTPGRTGSLLDCGLDAFGAAAGVWITSLGRPRPRR